MTLEKFDVWTESIQATEDRKLKEIFMRARLKVAARIDRTPASEAADDQFHFLTFAECSMPNGDRNNNEEE